MRTQSVTDLIQERRDSLSPTEQRIADYILKNTPKVVHFTVKDLAGASDVSEATVIRMCQHVGFTGFWPLRPALTAEVAKYQLEAERKAAPGGEATLDILGEFASMIENLKRNLNYDEVNAVVELIKQSDTVHLIAAGNTTPLIEHMGFRLGRLGVRNTFSGVDSYFLNQINLAGENDLVLAVSQSGASKSVIDGAALAKSKNLKIAAITAYKSSALAALSDHVIICKGDYSRFDIYVTYNHLAEMATIELLMALLERSEAVQKRVEKMNTLNLEIISDVKQ